jgi:hypothetical protein
MHDGPLIVRDVWQTQMRPCWPAVPETGSAAACARSSNWLPPYQENFPRVLQFSLKLAF